MGNRGGGDLAGFPGSRAPAAACPVRRPTAPGRMPPAIVTMSSVPSRASTSAGTRVAICATAAAGSAPSAAPAHEPLRGIAKVLRAGAIRPELRDCVNHVIYEIAVACYLVVMR